MRRTLAAALLALFSFSLIDPAIFAYGTESRLPSCCRTAGKHHCAMTRPAGVSIQPSLCPSFPSGRVATAAPQAGLLVSAPMLSVAMLRTEAYRPAEPVLYRVAFLSTCLKRGPPSFFLS